MKTLSQILIEVDKNPTQIEKVFAWDELVKNKHKYPLVQLEFAKEYLDIQTTEDLWTAKVGTIEFKNVNSNHSAFAGGYFVRAGYTSKTSSEAAEALRKAIEKVIQGDKKDSFLVKIVKKLTKMVEKLNQRLNSNRWRIYYWFYKK